MMIGANGQDVELLNIGPRPPVEVDAEIADMVRVLNENGYPTRASCSGHGVRPGNIALRDGRELIIARNHAEARRIETLLRGGSRCQDCGKESYGMVTTLRGTFCRPCFHGLTSNGLK